MTRRPARFSSLDTALLLAATAAWVVSFANLDAGHTQTALAEIGVAYLFAAVFLVRETRRVIWSM